MFTSRAEYRLRLRTDNADQRLTKWGRTLGVVGARRAAVNEDRSARLRELRRALDGVVVTPNEALARGLSVNQDGVRRTLFELLSYPNIDLSILRSGWPSLPVSPTWADAIIESDAKYAVYVERQASDLDEMRSDETIGLGRVDFGAIAGLSGELRQKLLAARPDNLARASRIEGMTPAALTLLAAHGARAGRGSR